MSQLSPAGVIPAPGNVADSPTPGPCAVAAESAASYTWGEGCNGFHLLRTHALSIIEEHMPPGTADTRHTHAHARQFFYVLAGELTLEVEGALHHIGADHGFEIPPGYPHQARNESAGGVRFLVTSQPPSHGDRQDA